MQEYLRYLVTLTAVLDPFLAIPIFIGVTARQDAAAQRRLANVVTFTVFLVLAGAVFLGEGLLKIMGASLEAFQVGGGLVLLLMALAMLNAQAGEMRQTPAEAAELEAGEVSGVVPLAVPLLAGPGAISTSIIAGEAGGAAHKLNVATRLLGLLLAAIAIQTMAEGLRRLFPGLLA